MKELNKKDKDKVVITKQQENETILELDKTIYPHFNHKLYEVNKKTLEVKLAEYNLESTYKLNWNWKKGDRLIGALSLIKNDDCVYISALNKKTALEKFYNNSDGSKFDQKKQYLKL